MKYVITMSMFLCLFVVSCTEQSSDTVCKDAYEVGIENAKLDCKNGQLSYDTGPGDPSEWVFIWKDNMEQQYGITVTFGGHYEDRQDLVCRIEGYNEEAERCMDEKYGKDFLEKTQNEAIADWESQLQNMKERGAKLITPGNQTETPNK